MDMKPPQIRISLEAVDLPGQAGTLIRDATEQVRRVPFNFGSMSGHLLLRHAPTIDAGWDETRVSAELTVIPDEYPGLLDLLVLLGYGRVE